MCILGIWSFLHWLYFGFFCSRSVGIGSGSSFKEENDDGVLEIWALKIWFWVLSQEGLLTS